MEIAVWDTYVKRANGTIMHFDILVPTKIINQNIIFGFGMHFLSTKSIQTKHLTAKECRLCHIEQATDDMMLSIKRNGYAIIEMENCD